jgi:hypothetical protein
VEAARDSEVVADCADGAIEGVQMTDTTTEHDLRMLARAAFTVIRELKPHTHYVINIFGYPITRDGPALIRANRYLDFVQRQSWQLWHDEHLRDDRIRMGFKP